jgi:hypothetical protein
VWRDSKVMGRAWDDVRARSIKSSVAEKGLAVISN